MVPEIMWLNNCYFQIHQYIKMISASVFLDINECNAFLVREWYWSLISNQSFVYVVDVFFSHYYPIGCLVIFDVVGYEHLMGCWK